MNTTDELHLADHVNGTVPTVFSTMIGAFACSTDDQRPLVGDRVSGTVGIAGETLNGAIYLHLPEALATRTTQIILQLPEGTRPQETEINDVIGELCNMIGGGLKSALNDEGRFCAMSTPSVIRGAFAVETAADVRAEKFYYTCLGHRLAVEVHLQPNQ